MVNPDFDFAIYHWLTWRESPSLDEDDLSFCGDMAICFAHCDEQDNQVAKTYLNAGRIPLWMYQRAEDEWIRRGGPLF